MIFIKSKRNIPILILDGFIYNLDTKKNKSENIRIFRCKIRAKDDSKGCPGIIKLDENNRVVTKIKHSFHVADPIECDKLITLYNLKNAANVDNDTTTNIITKVCSQQNLNSLQALPSVPYMRDYITRKRKKMI
ncbi:hypothetical protein GVAV_000539 [Gurleya vavrai]